MVKAPCGLQFLRSWLSELDGNEFLIVDQRVFTKTLLPAKTASPDVSRSSLPDASSKTRFADPVLRLTVKYGATPSLPRIEQVLSPGRALSRDFSRAWFWFTIKDTLHPVPISPSGLTADDGIYTSARFRMIYAWLAPRKYGLDETRETWAKTFPPIRLSA